MHSRKNKQTIFSSITISRDFKTNVTKTLPYAVMFNQPATLRQIRKKNGFGPFLRSVSIEPAMTIDGNGKFAHSKWTENS